VARSPGKPDCRESSEPDDRSLSTSGVVHVTDPHDEIELECSAYIVHLKALKFGIVKADDRPEPISITRCRELLGEEEDSMTDQEVELIRRHAETMACIVVEIYQRVARFPSRSRASETPLVRAREGITAADHGRRGDLRSRQHR
jgi:hypothetical protein